MVKVNHSEAQKEGKFKLNKDGEYVGEMVYKYEGDNAINIYKTEVDDAHEGKGYATKLLDSAVEFARENDLKIIPECPFVEAKMKKDESLHDLMKTSE